MNKYPPLVVQQTTSIIFENKNLLLTFQFTVGFLVNIDTNRQSLNRLTPNSHPLMEENRSECLRRIHSHSQPEVLFFCHSRRTKQDTSRATVEWFRSNDIYQLTSCGKRKCDVQKIFPPKIDSQDPPSLLLKNLWSMSLSRAWTRKTGQSNSVGVLRFMTLQTALQNTAMALR